MRSRESSSPFTPLSGSPEFVQSIYEAITASLNITARDTVLAVSRRVKVGAPVVRCRLREHLPSIMRARSTILLDGTPNLDHLKLFYRGVGELQVYEVSAQLGAYRLIQVHDRTFSPTMLARAAGSRKNANIRKLHAFICEQACRYRDINRSHGCKLRGRKIDVLVMAPKKVCARLKALGLPENVSIENWGATRGLNRYSDVPCGTFVGRSEPSETAIEDLTETLHYDDPSVIGLTRMADWRAKHGHGPKVRYRGRRRVVMVDGRVAEFDCEMHPDPHCEAVRHALVNAEFQQGVMRMRPYTRTERNPAEIFVFSDIDPGLPVHKFTRWVDVGETEAEMMITRGLVLTDAESAMRAYQDIFEGQGARMVRRILSEQIGMLPMLRDWLQVEFRLNAPTTDGRTAYKKTAFVAPTEPNPGELIAARLGCAIEWRRGGDADWQRAEPPSAGVQDGVQSLADAVDSVATQAVAKLDSVTHAAGTSRDQSSAA